jgi:hypothetical protein
MRSLGTDSKTSIGFMPLIVQHLFDRCSSNFDRGSILNVKIFFLRWMDGMSNTINDIVILMILIDSTSTLGINSSVDHGLER